MKEIIRNLKYLLKAVLFGWKESGIISSKTGCNKKRLSIYLEMIKCSRKYQMDSSQYSDHLFFSLSEEEKEKTGKDLKTQNSKRDNWSTVYYGNWKFLNKYSNFKWETSNRKRQKRRKAYINHYNLGKCWIQYGVIINCEHFSVGKLIVEDNVLLARGCDLDYTGNLAIGNGSLLSENVKILTHSHPYSDGENDHGLELTPLVIQDHVLFGARVLVLPGVVEIGRGALLSAGTVVRRKVPPYAIVTGNPSKVVGFRFTPEQILEYEKERYSIEDRLSEEILTKNYKKYYLDKLQEIRQFLS